MRYIFGSVMLVAALTATPALACEIEAKADTFSLPPAAGTTATQTIAGLLPTARSILPGCSDEQIIAAFLAANKWQPDTRLGDAPMIRAIGPVGVKPAVADVPQLETPVAVAAAAPAPKPTVDYAPQISALEAKLNELRNKPEASLTKGEQQQLESLPDVLTQLRQVQAAAEKAAAAAEQSASEAAGSALAAGGSATAAGLSADTAGKSAETAKTWAEKAAAAAQQATGWTLFHSIVAAMLALLSAAIVLLFVKKASKKSVAEVEQNQADGVKSQRGIEIPEYLEEHLNALAPGEAKEFDIVIGGEEVLVKFTKVNSNALRLKRQSVVTDDILDQTQPMRIDTLRTKLMGHIGAGRLSASTVKQRKDNVLGLTRDQEAA